MRRTLILILVWATCHGFCRLSAQEAEYLYEIGPGVGMSWTYGDVNRSSAIYDPQAAWNLTWRYNPNLRWALAVDFDLHHVKGDSRDFDYVTLGGQTWSFDRKCWQVVMRPEFSFWNYGWGSDYREKHRIAPFLTTGIGFGQASGSSTGSSERSSILTWPIGAGIKWKMAPRWDMQLTGIWSKCFGDDLDGFVDPYRMGTSSPINTDWIGQLMLSITFSFKERCFECHNQNHF